MSTTEQQDTIPSGTFNADTVHSSVSFEVGYMGIGKFNAEVTTFEARLADGVLSGAAQIETLEVKNPDFHAHLMAPDFFDAANHPTVSFSTTSSSAQGNEIVFDGEITIRGTSLPATLHGSVTGPVTDPYGNTRYGLKLSTTIDRAAYGITWNADMPDGTKALANEVTLSAELSLVEAS